MYNTEITKIEINFISYQAKKYAEPQVIQAGDTITLDDGCDYQVLSVNVFNAKWNEKMAKYCNSGNLAVKKPRGRKTYQVILSNAGNGFTVNSTRMTSI